MAGAEAMEETQPLLQQKAELGLRGVERERTRFTSSPAFQIHQSLLPLAELTLSLGDRCRAEQEVDLRASKPKTGRHQTDIYILCFMI